MLPTDSAERKTVPLHSGCYAYFPDALAAVAELSKIGNDKHNKGQPLHWSRDKSNDHADCIARHMQDAGADFMGVSEGDGGTLHIVQAAWRVLALAQLAVEAQKAGKPFNLTGYPTAVVSDDGWVKWGGGKCPVPGDTVVEVKYCDASVSPYIWQAEAFWWTHKGSAHDIAAYRIVK